MIGTSPLFEESSGYFCHNERFCLVRDGFSIKNPKQKTKTGSALVGFVVAGVSAPWKPSVKTARNPLCETIPGLR